MDGWMDGLLRCKVYYVLYIYFRKTLNFVANKTVKGIQVYIVSVMKRKEIIKQVLGGKRVHDSSFFYVRNLQST